VSESQTVINLPATRREIIPVQDSIPLLDTGKFEHFQRIATVMATSNLIPESLYTTGSGDQKEELAPNVVIANCFLVVNQAVRWGMDPFAVAQCVSVVKGKLCYEGKLIAAVIEAKSGVRLNFVYTSGQGDDLGVTVIGRFGNEDFDRVVEGTVGAWKTTGNGSPWIPKQYKSMLAYRGAREWSRRHSPGLMLGVYSDDELADMAEGARASRARNITPGEGAENAPRLERPRPPNPNAAAADLPTEPSSSVAPSNPEPTAAAQTNRPRPPNPNAAPAQQDAGDGLDIPDVLKRSQQSKDVEAERIGLFDLLKTGIDKCQSMADCFAWAQNNVKQQRLATLTPDQKKELDKAFAARQRVLNRD
jgi:hypothetical protein